MISFNRDYYTTYFSLCCFLAFLIWLGLFRILLPFGDEPDFIVRAPRLVSIEHPMWSPYFYFSELFSEFIYSTDCKIEGAPLALSSSIEFSSCREPLQQVLYRWLITTVIVLPLFIISLVRNRKGLVANDEKDVLLLSLLFPGMLYYLGLLAEEQLSLVLSLMVFLFWKNKILVALCVVFISLVDLGNSVVVVFFIALTVFYKQVFVKFGLKVVVVLMGVQVLLCLMLGYKALAYTANISFLADKSQAMYSLLDNTGLADKYPVILRPIITFMTFIFFTPSFIKAPIVYVLVALGFVAGMKNVYMLVRFGGGSDFQGRVLLLLVSLCTISSFVFLFPNYNNAKYYIFMLPFMMLPMLQVFGKLVLLFYFSLFNFLVLMHLIYYSL